MGLSAGTHSCYSANCIGYVMVHFISLLQKRLACVASVSARVRRESWEESKKRNDGGGGGGGERRNHLFFYRFRSNFRAITRLETLATQAKKR